jgi:TP901 family phage tail tape measure protein
MSDISGETNIGQVVDELKSAISELKAAFSGFSSSVGADLGKVVTQLNGIGVTARNTATTLTALRTPKMAAGSFEEFNAITMPAATNNYYKKAQDQMARQFAGRVDKLMQGVLTTTNFSQDAMPNARTLSQAYATKMASRVNAYAGLFFKEPATAGMASYSVFNDLLAKYSSRLNEDMGFLFSQTDRFRNSLSQAVTNEISLLSKAVSQQAKDAMKFFPTGGNMSELAAFGVSIGAQPQTNQEYQKILESYLRQIPVKDHKKGSVGFTPAQRDLLYAEYGAHRDSSGRVVFDEASNAYKAKYEEQQRFRAAAIGRSGVQGMLGGEDQATAAQKVTEELSAVGYRLITISYMTAKALTVFNNALNQAVSVASSYDMAMSKVQVMLEGSLGESTDQAERLRDAMFQISRETGTSFADLAQGAYDIVSAFPEATNKVQLLGVSSRMARAGVAATSVALKAMVTTSKTYGNQSGEFLQHIGDVSAATVKLGVIELPELASGLQRITPIAARMGVSVEEAAAAIGSLANVSGSPAQAATQVRAMLQAFMSPTKEMKKIFQKAGADSGAMFLNSFKDKGGLVGAMQFIQEQIGENGDWKKLFGRKEGAIAGMTIANEVGGTYNKMVAANINSTGELNDQFMKATTGVAYWNTEMQKANASLEQSVYRIGENMLPVMTTLKTILAGIADVFSHVSSSILTSVGAMLALTSAVGFFAGGAAIVVSTMQKLKTVEKLAWLANPGILGALVTAIAAVSIVVGTASVRAAKAQADYNELKNQMVYDTLAASSNRRSQLASGVEFGEYRAPLFPNGSNGYVDNDNIKYLKTRPTLDNPQTLTSIESYNAAITSKLNETQERIDNLDRDILNASIGSIPGVVFNPLLDSLNKEKTALENLTLELKRSRLREQKPGDEVYNEKVWRWANGGQDQAIIDNEWNAQMDKMKNTWAEMNLEIGEMRSGKIPQFNAEEKINKTIEGFHQIARQFSAETGKDFSTLISNIDKQITNGREIDDWKQIAEQLKIATQWGDSRDSWIGSVMGDSSASRQLEAMKNLINTYYQSNATLSPEAKTEILDKLVTLLDESAEEGIKNQRIAFAEWQREISARVRIMALDKSMNESPSLLEGGGSALSISGAYGTLIESMVKELATNDLSKTVLDAYGSEAMIAMGARPDESRMMIAKASRSVEQERAQTLGTYYFDDSQYRNLAWSAGGSKGSVETIGNADVKAVLGLDLGAIKEYASTDSFRKFAEGIQDTNRELSQLGVVFGENASKANELGVKIEELGRKSIDPANALIKDQLVGAMERLAEQKYSAEYQSKFDQTTGKQMLDEGKFNGILSMFGAMNPGAPQQLLGQSGSFASGLLGGFSDVLGGTFLKLVTSSESLLKVLNPLNTIIDGVFEVVSPVIDTILAPIIGALRIVGQVIGVLLIPVLQLLSPVISVLAGLFVSVYNFLVPVFEGIYDVFKFLGNVITIICGFILSAVYTFVGGIEFATNWMIDVINSMRSKKNQIAYVTLVSESDKELAKSMMETDLFAGTAGDTFQRIDTTQVAAAADTSSSSSGTSSTSAEVTKAPDQYFYAYINIGGVDAVTGFDGKIVSVDTIVDAVLDAMADRAEVEARA